GRSPTEALTAVGGTGDVAIAHDDCTVGANTSGATRIITGQITEPYHVGCCGPTNSLRITAADLAAVADYDRAVSVHAGSVALGITRQMAQPCDTPSGSPAEGFPDDVCTAATDHHRTIGVHSTGKAG